jgi:hypothetical protein
VSFAAWGQTGKKGLQNWLELCWGQTGKKGLQNWLLLFGNFLK